jgi:ABC-type bacteriocin/lantibiotic exporter with double-glycine peptidase domain
VLISARTDDVCRFYEPSSGQIHVHGEDVAARSVNEIRQGMALVPQDHFLYRGENCDAILVEPDIADTVQDLYGRTCVLVSKCPERT